ncbi:hypothetical protein ACXM2N_06690 [Corynebacterium sp. ZY180755]
MSKHYFQHPHQKPAHYLKNFLHKQTVFEANFSINDRVRIHRIPAGYVKISRELVDCVNGEI